MVMRPGREDELGDHEVAELAALADGSLAPDRRAALEARVAASAELADRLAEQKRAVALAQGAVEGVEAPAGLRARIEAGQRAPRRTTSRRLVAIGAPAAALVVAVVALVVVVTSGTSEKQFHAALAATDLAPAASGQATLTKTTSGWRIEFDATGLPRLDNGRFYEAWLKNSAGVLVPVGTFNEGRHVTLWSGVGPTKGFTTLSVTRERADGDQTSSGEKVLVGPVQTRR
jgi:anti-sigma-K factor RskA